MTAARVPPKKRRRVDVWHVAALAFVAGCVYVMMRLMALQQQQAADSTAITQLSNALTTTRQQLQQHGVTPKAAPPSEIIQGVAGAQGIQGIPGGVGPSGAPGKDAPTPNLAAIASLAAGMVHPSPGPSGPPGVQGVAGQPGQSGQPGQDGKDGQPPAGWTTTYPDGSTETCQRAANFDPNNPRYACTVTSPSSPSPTPTSPSPTPSQSGTTQSQAKPRPKQVVVSTGPR